VVSEAQDQVNLRVVAAARQDVEELAASGRWTGDDERELERQFVRARSAAMRAPRIAERSLLLRRLARFTVPRKLRPRLRYGLARIERAIGEWRDRDAI
jgi:hypothetical protein